MSTVSPVTGSGAPIAMGYVPADKNTPGTALEARVRNKTVPMEVVKLPFRAHNYYRG